MMADKRDCVKKIYYKFIIFAYILVLSASVLGFASYAGAAAEDFGDYLKTCGLGSYVEEYPTVFFPPAHSPAASLKDSPKTVAAVIMPLIYCLNEKYPLYPDESVASGDKDDNFSKYIAKIDNLSPNIALKIVLDHLSSPFLMCELDIFANTTLAWFQNFYISSVIKHESLPVALTFADGGLNIENTLLYYYINTSEYCVYLMYSPFKAPAGNFDLIYRALVYDKSEMKFFINLAPSKNYRPGVAELSFLFIHDLKYIAGKFDRFNKAGGDKPDFSGMYEFLKMQIEKKIIKDENKLKNYRYYAFLSAARREKLAGLIKNIKTDILEPKIATYSSRFADLKPLQAEMAEKNKNEQQRAILKKFSFLNEKLQKMNITLTPKSEYDIIFKKLNINNN